MEMTCDFCGKDLSKRITTASFYIVDGHVFCNEAEAKSFGYVRCKCCGKIHPRTASVNDSRFASDWYCHECARTMIKNKQAFTCSDCGRFYAAPPSTFTIGGQKKRLCSGCVLHYRQCERCHGWYHESDLVSVTSGDYRRTICHSCNEQFGLCASCINFYEHSEMTTYMGDTLCQCCAGERDQSYCERNGLIKGYHSSHEDSYEPIVAKPSEERGLLYGFELETERFKGKWLKETIEQIIEMDREKYFYIERDGSLTRGFEMITRPFSLNMYPKVRDLTSEIMSFLRESGYDSGKEPRSNAGLHIHVTKLYDVYEQAKLLVLYERVAPAILAVSRRTSGSFSRWSKIRPVDYYPEELGISKYKDKVRRISDVIASGGVGHRHDCINITNRHTIEFRLFKGTLYPEELDAALDFVNFSLKLAKEASEYAIYKMTTRSFMEKAKRYSPCLKEYIKRVCEHKENSDQLSLAA